MEIGSTECLAVAVVLLTALYIYLTWNFNVWKNMGVPGPKPWPYLGSMPSFLTRPAFLVDADHLKKYGKVYGLFEGRKPSLMVADLEMLKSIYIKDFPSFMDRRTMDLSRIDPSFNYMLTSLEGEKWRSARSIFSPAFTSGKLKAMTPLLAKAGATLASVVEKKHAETGKSMEVKEVFGCYTLDVIASCGFGVEVNSLEDPTNEFVVNATKLMNFSMFWALVLTFFPFLLKYFRIPFFNLKALDYFKAATVSIIEERRRTKQQRADFVQLMLEAEEQEVENTKTSSDPELEKPQRKFLTNDMIIGQSIQFFLAGFETVSLTMAYAAYCLATNPEKQEILVREIDEVIEKHGDLTYDAIADMTYLDMVLSETLRMYPAAIRTERKCVEDYTYENIKITKGTIVGTSVYAIHHSEEIYSNAEEFCPERFSSENKGKIHSMAYLPFGAGPRNCIGMRFAILECKVALAQLLRRLILVPGPETEVPLVFKPFSARFYPEKGIKLLAQKRT